MRALTRPTDLSQRLYPTYVQHFRIPVVMVDVSAHWALNRHNISSGRYHHQLLRPWTVKGKGELLIEGIKRGQSKGEGTLSLIAVFPCPFYKTPFLSSRTR